MGESGEAGSPVIHRYDAAFLNLRRLPASLNMRQLQAVLGRNEDETRAIVGEGLLPPLGDPPQNAVKHFCTSQVLDITQDFDWWQKVERFLKKRSSTKSKKQKQ